MRILIMSFLLVASVGQSSPKDHTPAAPPSVNEGHIAGNGGDVVVCRNAEGETTSVELLDFYEGRTVRGINYNLGGPEISYEEKVMLAISRWLPLSPWRAAQYQEYADKFMSETRFMERESLPDVQDSLYPSVPNGCKIEQIAIQKRPVFPEDRLYTINKELWDQLDNDNKAGLILHEIIYREAIDLYQHKNSWTVRYVNSYLSADKLKDFTTKSFVEFLQQADFRWTDIDGLMVKVPTVRFDHNGGLDFAWLQPFGKDELLWEEGLDVRGIILPTASAESTVVGFYPGSNKLKYFRIKYGIFSNGNGGGIVSEKCWVELYENRKVKSLCLVNPDNMKMADGTEQLIPAGYEIRFNTEGLVTEAIRPKPE